jgi:hypothetical protein
MSLKERALAKFETSPALAFIFSSPIMNSDTTRDWVGKPCLGKRWEMVESGLQEVDFLTICHLNPQSSWTWSHFD